MTRYWLPLCGVVALAACAPQVPDSAAGVGFGNYDTYQREALAREGQLQTPLHLSPEKSGAPEATGRAGAPAISSTELAAAGIDTSPRVRVKQGATRVYGPTVQERPTDGPSAQVSPIPPTATASTRARAVTPAAANGVTPAATAAPANPTGQPIGAQARAGDVISDEQSFAAVSARETIQSDAARRTDQQAQYQQVQVTSSANTDTNTGPDIVAYALRSSNPVGQKLYSRGFASQTKAARNCARFAAPDVAQRAFLETGGPQRDRYGIDPDGDGFACGWSPDPFRNAVKG